MTAALARRMNTIFRGKHVEVDARAPDQPPDVHAACNAIPSHYVPRGRRCREWRFGGGPREGPKMKGPGRRPACAKSSRSRGGGRGERREGEPEFGDDQRTASATPTALSSVSRIRRRKHGSISWSGETQVRGARVRWMVDEEVAHAGVEQTGCTHLPVCRKRRAGVAAANDAANDAANFASFTVRPSLVQSVEGTSHWVGNREVELVEPFWSLATEETHSPREQTQPRLQSPPHRKVAEAKRIVAGNTTTATSTSLLPSRASFEAKADARYAGGNILHHFTTIHRNHFTISFVLVIELHFGRHAHVRLSEGRSFAHRLLADEAAQSGSRRGLVGALGVVARCHLSRLEGEYRQRRHR